MGSWVATLFALSSFKLVVLVLWIPVAVGAVYMAWRLALREYPLPAAALAAVALLGGLSLFPLTLGRTVSSAYHLEQHRRQQAHRPEGPLECLTASRCYPTRMMNAARAIVPPHARYYIQVSKPHQTGIFRFWSFTALLPRVAVTSPQDADWVVSWSSDLGKLPVSYAQVRHVSPLLTVAEVAP